MVCMLCGLTSFISTSRGGKLILFLIDLKLHKKITGQRELSILTTPTGWNRIQDLLHSNAYSATAPMPTLS